jgi:hypothetical protein
MKWSWVMSEYETDGLSDFSLEQIGQRTGAFGGARLLKYVTDHFVTREGEAIEPSREMAVLGLKKVVQKFVGQKLVDTIIVPDGEKMSDLAAMNEAAPREEWGKDLNGNPVGPFVRVLLLKMLDVKTMDRFAFVTSSVGGSIAIGDLSDKTKIMRRFNGPNVVPVISCSVTNFKTKFGVRKRPDFRVLRWMALGGGGGGLPKPEPKKFLAAPTVPAVEQQETTIGKPVAFGTPVTPPTLREETQDEVPF